MRLLDHGRKAGYLGAWRALGLRQTYGPEISNWRRIWMRLKTLWRAVTLWVDPSFPVLRADRTEMSDR